MILADINGDDIAKANFKQDKAFEQFVGELLEHELDQRHAASAELEGPMKAGPGDGQRDLIVRVVEPPVTSRGGYRHALTFDEPGEHWYSCKGGSKWKESLKTELGNEAYRCFNRDRSLPTTKTKGPSEVLLRHLSAGGRYVFVISEQFIGSTELLGQLSELLSWWLEQRGLKVPDHLQLEFIDANRLARFIKQHTRTLSGPVMAALNAHEPDAVLSIEAWARRIKVGREPPQFEPDSQRDRLRDAIAALQHGASKTRILRIHGPPGVGKTRAVYEALSEQAEVRARVRYTDAPAALLNPMRKWLEGSQRLILVVDEVRSLDATEFVHRFSSDSDLGSRMIMVGTSDDEAGADFGGLVSTFRLDTLADAATRALIDHEFQREGAEPDVRTQIILDLSEGYPLFAVKLAQALALDGDALEQGTDESNQWSAAQRVLVGPRTGVEQWEEKTELSGRCLMVVLLTNGWPMEWELLWERHGERLAKAVDRDADELRRAKADCMARELLREVDHRHRYVSPANLVRIILNHYLSGPPGPDLGPRIVRHVPEFRAHLMDLAQRVHVQPAVLERLAAAEWYELERLLEQRDVAALERLLASASGPGRACELDPTGAAQTLAKITLAIAEQLHPTARRVLAQNLTHATRRRIDEQTFAVAERAMLRLALLEDSDTYAQEAWAALFLVRLSPTHQPWPVRFELLASHARSTQLDERRLVAAMLRSLLGDDRVGPHYFEPDTLDGEWPEVSTGTYLEGRRQLWELAIELTADPDPDVAKLARAVVAECWGGGGIRRQSVELLPSLVAGWSPAQRQKLLEAIRNANRRHQPELDAHPDYAAVLTELMAALEPTDLTSQIIAQVSSERPIPLWAENELDDWIERTDASDRELAEQLLRASEEVREPILEWLASTEAVRGGAFMRQVGRADRGRILLARFEQGARKNSDTRLLPAYVAAWGETDPDAADAWLRAHVDEFPAVVIAAISSRAPTPRRFELLEHLVESSRVDTAQMRGFAERRWAQVVDAARAFGLLELMHERNIAPTPGLEMTLQVLDAQGDDELRSQALELLDRFLTASRDQRVPMIAQRAWERAVVLLAEVGRMERVAEHLLSLLGDHFGSLALAERVLENLLAGGHGPALWRHLRDALLDDRYRGVEEHLARVGMLGFLDTEELLAWVGGDRGRGQLVARMVNPYTEQLDRVAVGLLRCFGASTSVARELRRRALTSPLATSVLEFERRQFANAEVWSQSVESPEVQAWARALATELHELVQAHEFRDQSRRKYA